MTHRQIDLQMTGAAMSLRFLRYLDDENGYWDIEITLSAHTDKMNLQFQTDPCFFSSHDLKRLIQYFDQHLENIAINPHHESATYVNTEMALQIQALSGHYEDENTGEFALRILLNIGKDKEEASVYAGVESNISVNELNKFKLAILDSLQNPY